MKLPCWLTGEDNTIDVLVAGAEFGEGGQVMNNGIDRVKMSMPFAE